MPFLTVHTNCKAADAQKFLAEATEFVATELHKPLSYIIVTYDYQENMLFGSKPEVKSALVEMKSIGFADKTALAQNLTTFLAQKLGAQADFINIHFIDMPAKDLSIGGHLLG